MEQAAFLDSTFFDFGSGFPPKKWSIRIVKRRRTTVCVQATEPDRKRLRHRPSRTVKTKGCLNRKTALAMPFKLILSAKRKWRKLNGSDQLADIIDGVPFKDGIKQIERAA